MISEATIFEVLRLGIKFMYRIQGIGGKFANVLCAYLLYTFLYFNTSRVPGT